MNLNNYYFYFIFNLLIKPWEIIGITTIRIHNPQELVRSHRHQKGPAPSIDWELGLKEAVYQSLTRNYHHHLHNEHANIKSKLLEAPIIGQQNYATPFGDIAVLARGQLFATPDGYQFQQDPYYNDCDGCHSIKIKCSPRLCPWNISTQNHKLLALWTVKRVRHRDLNYGHIFEIEYTISPIHDDNDLYLQHGCLNYNLPGHVFIVKSDPPLNSAIYSKSNIKQNQDYPEFNYSDFQSVPHYYQRSQTPSHSTTIRNDEKEYNLYRKLIESLSSKTTTTKNPFYFPHRFGIPYTKPMYHHVGPTYPSVPQTSYHLTDDNIISFIPTTIQQIPKQTTKIYIPTEKIPTSSKPLTAPITTIHYYTATVEQPQTTPQLTKLQETASHSSNIWPTTSTTTTPSTLLSFDYFDKLFPTTSTVETTNNDVSKESRKMTTQTSTKKYPESINEQLPTPAKDLVDTTIPYVLVTTESNSITHKYPTILQTRKFTKKQNEATTDAKDFTEATNQQKLTTQFEESLLTTKPNESSTAFKDFLPITKQHVITTTEFRRDQETTKQQEITRLEEHPQTIQRETTTDSYDFPQSINEQDITTESIFTTQQRAVRTEYQKVQQITNKIYDEIKQPTTFATMKQNKDITLVLPTSTYINMSNQTTTSSTPTETPFGTNTVNTTIPIQKISKSSHSTTTPISHVTKKKYTRKPKPLKTTLKDDFLIDDNHNQENTTNNKKDVSNNDIFGTQQGRPRVRRPTKAPVKKVIKSDLEVALFGDNDNNNNNVNNNRHPKQIKLFSKLQPSTTVKVIYSNFFETPIETTTPLFDISNNILYGSTTHQQRPLTDQSVSTSISFEVNKKNQPEFTSEVSSITTTKTDNLGYDVYKAEYPPNRKRSKKDFDNFALQLVNHARSIDYLKRQQNQSKYRRRNFNVNKRKRRPVKAQPQ